MKGERIRRVALPNLCAALESAIVTITIYCAIKVTYVGQP